MCIQGNAFKAAIPLTPHVVHLTNIISVRSIPSFNSNANKASSAGQTRTLPVLSTPAFSGRWDTRAASEEEGEEVEAERGHCGVGSRRVKFLGVVCGQEEEDVEGDGHGSGMVYTLLMLVFRGSEAGDKMACRRSRQRA